MNDKISAGAYKWAKKNGFKFVTTLVWNHETDEPEVIDREPIEYYLAESVTYEEDDAYQVAQEDRRRKHEALRRSYQRKRAFTATGLVGDKKFIYGMVHKLEDISGKTLPDDFSGTADDLAEALGMKIEKMAKRFNKLPDATRRPTVDDLRALGTITISV
ncbi:hypothetical protein ACFSWE_04005 [Leucobacter albus]|uniref:Uncharacterized protein n=1 Tax=Leucobacter albus TaxID=272210 RepID=A0ABW3TPM1_9MICO